MTTRHKYSREFKVGAVRMITQQNLSVAEVARDLDVNGAWFYDGPDSFHTLALSNRETFLLQIDTVKLHSDKGDSSQESLGPGSTRS